MPTDLDALGGPDVLLRLTRAFVDRMSRDFVIGFFFDGKDLDRIARMEASLAASHLGSATYEGRPIGAVHGKLGINAGQFRRRLAILRTVLTEQGVPAEVVARWVDHDRRLEALITDGSDCREP